MTEVANADQAEFWNAGPGQIWVRRQADLDALSAGVTDLLLGACAPRPGERALDVGCGAGASTFALAEAVGGTGRVTGVDISAPLVARAEALRAERGAANVAFEVGDAQGHPFAPQGFDLVASRFGLMFFADPVAAFANLRRGLRPGGRIAFAAWAGPEHNPWFALPRGIAEEQLGPGAPSDPDAPGPMAFRDVARVRGLLAEAGFAAAGGVLAQTHLHHPGGVAAVADLAAEVGPTARLMREKNGTDADRRAITERLAAELQPFRSPDGIRIPAGINLFSAAAP